MQVLNKKCLIAFLFLFSSCKTMSTQSNVSGIGTDLDNSEGRLYLYSVEDGRLLRQYECPLARPIIKSNCKALGRTLVLESFEAELRKLIQDDIAKTTRLIESYANAYAALLKRAAENPTDATDLRAQAEKVLAERQKEERRLTGFNGELAVLTDTLAKLKDQEIDYEMTRSDDWYKENRPTVSRFKSLMSISKRYMDVGHGKYSQLMYQSLDEASAAVRLRCPTDMSCHQWIAHQSKKLETLESVFPVTESDWNFFEFGPEIAQKSKELADGYCRIEVSGEITEAFVAYANRLKEKVLDPLQTRSPSLKGRLTGCRFRAE